MEEEIKKILSNYKELPKSQNDDGEFVIIAERNEGGSYEEYKECLGVNEKGELIWCYLSGCSCYGTNENSKVTDITSKMFKVISGDPTVEEFYKENKIEPYITSYCTY